MQSRGAGNDISGDQMLSFARFLSIMSAFTLTLVASIAAPAAQAQVADGAPGAIRVPCNTDALVAAIGSANSRGGATLLLASNCTYSITTPATAADGLPIITGKIGLVGRLRTVISRGSNALTAFRLLDVAPGGMLSLSNISIRNGSTQGLGGGIQNAGTLQVSLAKLSGNRAGNGGALANLAGATARVINTLIDGNTTTGVGGGGIINSGTLTLSGSSLVDNSAPINGGGLNTQPAGTSRIVRSAFLLNVSGSLGGGISNLGTTSLEDTTVQRNTGSGGGGIATGNNHVTLQGSTVQNNSPDNCSPLNTIPGCVN
jgi:hypothetical protein